MREISDNLDKLALQIVKESNHSWLKSDDIINNLLEEEFIVDQDIKGESSCLFYNKEKHEKRIAVNRNLNETKQIKELLFQYSYYKLNETKQEKGYFLCYHNSIKGQEKLNSKLLAKAITNYSIDKQLGEMNIESRNENEKNK